METRKNTPGQIGRLIVPYLTKKLESSIPEGSKCACDPFKVVAKSSRIRWVFDHWLIDIEETHPPTTASKAVRRSS